MYNCYLLHATRTKNIEDATKAFKFLFVFRTKLRQHSDTFVIFNCKTT